jgi:polar amino acid transport system substrate-binding protein
VIEGKADMMLALRKTPERQRKLHYLSSPIKIQHLPLRFYVRANNGIEINSYEDLQTITVGVLRGVSYFDRFDLDTTIDKVPITTRKQLIDMLLKGRIDTFLEREESITPIIDEKTYIDGIKLAKYAYEKSVVSYIAISKKSPLADELEQLSAALNTLHSNGTMKKLLLSEQK